MLGNMVLACAMCDDSMAARPYDEWMVGNAPKSPRNRRIANIEHRIEHLKAYVKVFEYVASPVEYGLTQTELQRLTNIRSELSTLRIEADLLVGDYRRRTGYS